MQEKDVYAKMATKGSLQQKQSLRNPLIIKHSQLKSLPLKFQKDQDIKHSLNQKTQSLESQGRQLRGQIESDALQMEGSKGFQKSININIKSTTKELIESKQYENKLVNQWTPVFANVNQQQSVQLPSGQTNTKQQKKKYEQEQQKRKYEQLHKHVQYPYLLEEQSNSCDTRNEICSDIDVQKLSKMYCEVMLKEDSKRIKRLNTINQQLKLVCKKIVGLLRRENQNTKNNREDQNTKNNREDQLIVKEIYEVITNYHKKSSTT